MKRIMSVIAVIGVMFFSNAYAENKYVEMVKGAVLENWNYTTIGKAFDVSFSNTTWTYFETKKGMKVVVFKGKITKELHELAVKQMPMDKFTREGIMLGLLNKTEITGAYFPIGTEVSVEWLINARGDGFEMGYFGPHDKVGDDAMRFLNIVYS